MLKLKVELHNDDKTLFKAERDVQKVKDLVVDFAKNHRKGVFDLLRNKK